MDGELEIRRDLQTREEHGAIYFRVDASPAIGLGHLSRCLVLARQVKSDGFSVLLIGRFRFGIEIERLLENFNVVWLEDTEIGKKKN